PKDLQQLYVMSDPIIAFESEVCIEIMKGLYKEQFKVSPTDYHTYWQVIDRTTGVELETDAWYFDTHSESVVIKTATLFHEYTVNFLVYQIWDPTEMYNHLTNHWGDRHHEMPYDMRHPETNQHIKDYLAQWLTSNQEVDVVRFTTFFYHFTLVYNDMKKEKFVDWFGYSSTLSHEAIEAFKEEKGYELKAEHIVDEGYFNNPFRIPSKAFLDYIDFQSKFVCEEAKVLVDMTHNAGKEAMMFLGDNWIGTEPYGKYFENIGIDAVVGSVGNGTTLRMISDIPGVKYTEGRFLPYFFPDVFHEGGNPVKEAKENWIQGRRAILQSPVQRIGYGGYLSLALKFPEFVSTVEKISNEFNVFHDLVKDTKGYKAPFKVGVLNCWGKIRSWQTNQVAHALWYKEIYSYVGVLESLSGLSFDVEFINFEDIKAGGIPSDVGVIINSGDAMTAWSGGDNWLDEDIITAIREWVYNGGGFIGVGEPTAIQNQGKYFQLFDVLGVDKEMTFGLSYRKYHHLTSNHFILEDVLGDIDFGRGMNGVFKKGENTQILAMKDNDILLSTNEYGSGRAVYISGLPYSAQNARLLTRAIYYAAHKEEVMKTYYVDNMEVECVYFPEVKQLAVYNNSITPQRATLYVQGQLFKTLELADSEMIWIEL
ncbi:MAG: 1,3-beta-galactosyl-N-acetylhexosamine phosphorylase, partial [Turicibacter sp.]